MSEQGETSDAPEWPRWVKPAVICLAPLAVLMTVSLIVAGLQADDEATEATTTTAPATTEATTTEDDAPTTTEATTTEDDAPTTTEATTTTEAPTTTDAPTTTAAPTTTEPEPTEDEVWLDRVREANSSPDIEILDVEISGSVLRIVTSLGYAPDDSVRRGMAAGVCFDVVFGTDWVDHIEVRANNGGVLAWTGASNDGCRGYS